MDSVIKSDIQMTHKKLDDLLDGKCIHPGYEKHRKTLKKNV